MSKAFNLTAQLNLQGPNNLKPIVAKIKRELGSINANVKFNLDGKAAKSVDAIKSRLSAMNNVLISAKNNTNELNAALRGLSSSLSAVRGTSGQAGSSVSLIAKNSEAAAKSIKVASSQMEEFGKQSFLAIKRFAAFSIVSSGIYSLINALSSGVKSFIEFDRQMIRLQQTTGDGAIALKGLGDQITLLSKTLGVSSEKLTEIAVTLAQAGLSANETKQALSALAKTELAPSFDNLTDTTEGAIAAMRQFGIATKDLEGALGSINSVAAAFAVESSDIIVAIQRAGGAFAASSNGVAEGTDALNQFLAVFTSVRATTRESAETIATGLRTIFTRIQRPKTIDFLRDFGVELTDLEGKFVGPYEAVKRLSSVLNTLDPRDLRFSQIVEELGGFRQISKVIPLIQQFATAEKALAIAQKGQGSLTKAQETAQKSLAVQLAKVREEFLALIRTVGQSDTFQGFFKIVVGLSSALIKLAGAFKPILPALAILGTIKGGKAVTQFAGGFLGSFRKGGGAKSAGSTLGETITGSREKDTAEVTSRASEALKTNTTALDILTKSIDDLNTTIQSRGGSGPSTLNKGGKVLGFARGGVVPGTGNSDTVPAMLTAGEFVIRKKAVERIGSANLHKMNKYANGGFAAAPLVDDIKTNASGAMLPSKIALEKIIQTGYGALDFDRTLKRTTGDAAYGKAKTSQQKDAVLSKYFKDPSARLADAKNSRLTQFGRMLIQSIKEGKVDPRKLSIISKSGRTPGLAEHINELFGIPVDNMAFTSGNDKGPALEALRAKGPRANRVSRFALGGAIQKFMAGGNVDSPKLINRGALNYSLEDILKAGLTEEQFLEKIPVPPPLMAVNPKPGEYGTQFKIGGIGPEAVPMPKFLKPYLPPDSAAFQSSQDAVFKRSEAAVEYRKKKGLTPRDYEGKSSTEKNFLSAKMRGYKLGGEVYSLQDGTGLKNIEFDEIVKFANTNDFSMIEFKEYLAKRLAQRKANKDRKQDSASLLKAITPDTTPQPPSASQASLIAQLRGPPDAKYNPKYDNAVQKFAAGGLIEDIRKGTKEVGAAILQPGNLREGSFEISPDDVRKAIGGQKVINLPRLGRFNVFRKGLSPETGGIFDEALNKGIINGVNSATSLLSSRLKIPFSPINKSKKDKFLAGINDGTRGNLFEDALLAMQGSFDKRESQQPFDFPNGLKGVLANDFAGLPDKWIDAKASYKQAKISGETGSLENKTLRQITNEIKSNPTEYLSPNQAQAEPINITRPEVAPAPDVATNPNLKKFPAGTYHKFNELIAGGISAKEIRSNFQETGSKKWRRKDTETLAAGGGISGQDTVPALLTPGEFVINKQAAKKIGSAKLNKLNKADKIQGFNKGGGVGFIQHLAGGGSANPAVIAAFTDAAERAGMSLRAFEAELKAQSLNKSLAKTAERRAVRADLRTDIIKTAAKGLGDKDSQKQFFDRLKTRIKELSPSASDKEINQSTKEIFAAIKAGKPLEDLLSSTSKALEPLRDSFNATRDNCIALAEAQSELASEFGGLTDAVAATLDELETTEYKSSGKAAEDFGLFGDLFAQQALDYKKTSGGSGMLGAAKNFQNLGINGLSDALGKLPGPLGDAVKAIGGIPGVIAGGISILGESLTESNLFGNSTMGAGLAGALSGAGSQALSLGTLGQQLAGPIGGMIGTIGGAVAGAIDGFLAGMKTKQLENSMSALNASIEGANKSLDNLAKYDSEANYKAASKSVGAIRENMNDLAYQAKSTLDEKAISGAGGFAKGATYGGIATGAAVLGINAFAASTFAASLTGIAGSVAMAAGVIASIPAAPLIATGAAIAAVGYGLYSFYKGTEDIDAQALEGQLKAIENYVQGLSQLATRRINLSSLEDIEKNIQSYEGSKTPEAKQRLGAQSKFIEEAQRGAFLRAGYDIDQGANIKQFANEKGLTGQLKTIGDEAAFALAAAEVNQTLAGNEKAIKAELAQKEKLIKRGYQLAAEQEYQVNLQARLAATMREVNLQTESIVEIFDKMISTVERFSNEMTASQTRVDEMAAAMSGNFQLGSISRRDEQILSNSGAYSDDEFNQVITKLSKLTGEGANAERVTNALSGRRMIELQLPNILRGATQKDVGSVVSQMEDLFDKTGITGEARDSLLKQIEESLEKEGSSRQAKSFSELADEFESLKSVMQITDAAYNAGKKILEEANNQSERYGENLNKINDALQKSLELTIQGDEIRLESAMKLDEIYGRRSEITSASIVDSRIRRYSEAGGIAGGSLSPTDIGSELSEVLEKIEINRANVQDASGQSRLDLMAEQGKLGRQANNLTKALEELANNSERTAQIMADFQEYQNVANNSKSFAERVLTADPEELSQIQKELDAARSYAEGSASQAQRADPEFRRLAFKGLEGIQGSLGLTDQQISDLRSKLISGMINGLPGGQGAEIMGMRAGEVRDGSETRGVTWQEILTGLPEEFATRLKAAEEDRQAAIKALIQKQEEVGKIYATENDKVVTALQELTRQLNEITGLTPSAAVSAATSAAAASGGSMPEPVGNPAANPVVVKEFKDELQKMFSQKWLLEQKAIGNLHPFDEGKLASLQNDIKTFKEKYQERFGSLPSIENDAVDLGIEAIGKDLADRAERARQGTETPRYNPLPSPSSPSAPTTQPSSAPIPVTRPERKDQADMAVATTAGAAGGSAATRSFSLLSIDDNTKTFLANFQKSMDSFGGYVTSLENIVSKIPKIPERIEMQGRHTVQVDIRGGELFEKMKKEFGDLVTNEVRKQMNRQWNQTGGELGSSGSAGRAVQDIPQF